MGHYERLINEIERVLNLPPAERLEASGGLYEMVNNATWLPERVRDRAAGYLFYMMETENPEADTPAFLGWALGEIERAAQAAAERRSFPATRNAMTERLRRELAA